LEIWGLPNGAILQSDVVKTEADFENAKIANGF
jgi:hypothetical protein